VGFLPTSSVYIADLARVSIASLPRDSLVHTFHQGKTSPNLDWCLGRGQKSSQIPPDIVATTKDDDVDRIYKAMLREIEHVEQAGQQQLPPPEWLRSVLDIPTR
jgi:hypothetical protein